MAGKHIFSIVPQVWEYNPRTARAYCEGVAYRQAGTELGNPKTDNPYAKPNSDELDAWGEGWEFANLDTGSAITPTNCAVYGTVAA